MGEITADSMVIVGPRRRGRPRAQEPCVPVTTWIPLSAYNDLTKQALQEDTSVSKLLRERVVPPTRR